MSTDTNIMQYKPDNSAIFSSIYKTNAWGGMKGQFYSGTGSHNDQIFGYSKTIADFIIKNQVQKIVEIGCGDFYVANLIIQILEDRNHQFSYLGYDVVEQLIEENRSIYASEKISFRFADASIEDVESGDILIIRQVLQHLDNQSISHIIKKFKYFKFAIVTEHQILEDYGYVIPNLDMKPEAGTRLGFRSGVYLEREPFNCSIKQRLYSIPESAYHHNASINTYLIVC